MTKQCKTETPKKVELTIADLNDDLVNKYFLCKRIRNAALDMMSKVKFIDEHGEHRYETMGGTWLQGVSTVSQIVPKEWLAPWGAKEAVKALGYSDYEGDTELAKETMEKISKIKTPEEFIKLLKEVKGASRTKNKEALIDGTTGHAWLEDYIKALMRKEPAPAFPDGLLERPTKQFVEWAGANVSNWILSEAKVADIKMGYAGTLDAVAIMKDGKLALVDFKFASHLSEDYYLQTAGYQATFEPYDIHFDERILIRLPKTLEREEWNKEKRCYEKIPNNIEVEIVPTDYEMDKNTFYHCLPVKMWINKVATYKKDDNKKEE